MAGDALERAQARREAAQLAVAGMPDAQRQRVAELHARYGVGVLAVPLSRAQADDETVLRVAEAKARTEQARARVGQETTGGLASQLWSGLVAGTKSIVRYGGAGAMFVPEVTQATFRGIGASLGHGEGTGLSGGAGSILRQTTIGAGVAEAAEAGQLGESLVGIFTGDGGADERFAGDGWWINPNTSRTGKRQVREARAAQLVDGEDGKTHAGTLGRNVADLTPLEPGSLPYNTVSGTFDFFVQLAAPGPKGKARPGAARPAQDATKLVEVDAPGFAPTQYPKTREEFDATDIGLVDGIRKTVLPERFAEWLGADSGGARVAQAMADTKDFNTLWRGTGKKLPVDLVVRLVEADDPLAVKNILVEAAQNGLLREKVQFAQAPRKQRRILSMMPSTKVDLADTDDVVEQMDRFQRNVLMDEKQISANNLAIARAATKGERYNLVSTILDVTRKGLIAKGFTEREAATYVRMFGDAREGNRMYTVDLIADGDSIRYGKSVRLAGTDIEIDGPHRVAQLIDRYVPLPSARELKRAHRQLQWVRDLESSTGFRVAADTLDFLTQDVFKPLALVTRPAYPIRVIGEEQLRMGAAHFASAFHHPISYLAWLAADKPTHAVKVRAGANALSERNPGGTEEVVEVPSRFYQMFAKRRGAPNFGADATGRRFDEEDMVEGVSAWRQSLSADSGGWADLVVRPSLRHVNPIRPNEPEFVDGWLRMELVELASDPVAREIARNGPDHVKALFWDGSLQGFRRQLAGSLKDTKGRPVDLDDKTISDAYVDMMAGEVAKFTAGHHPDLVKAVAHGKLRGHPLTDGLVPNKLAAKELEALLAEGVHPPAVRGMVRDTGDGSPGAKMLRHWENAVQEAFRMMMSVPTNRLSRSPVFRQAYWQRMTELAHLMPKADRARLLRNAKDAGVDKKIQARIREAIDANDLDGVLALENADTLAKHFGLTTTRDLLYSLHEKAQIADALRVVFPFGEAWREVLTRWTKLSKTNPRVGYRALQAGPAAERSGLIYPDPTTGQEMFAIPGSEWATEKLTGVPMKSEATVAGLSMFGTVLPGAGFAVTMPLSKVLPDHPSVDFVRETVLPFGDPDTGGGFLETFFPAYAKKLMAAAGVHPSPRSQRQLAATTRDVMAYLYSTGEYDISTAAGQDRLMNDAKTRARVLFMIRGIAQSTAPSAPVAKFYAYDKSGRLALLNELQADYRRMQEQDFETADERFMRKWGEHAFLATVPKTRGTTVFSMTEAASDFARAHPKQADLFPNVIGLFAPSGPNPKPALGETERQLEAGVRDITNPRDAIKAHNIRVANILYDRARERLGDDQRALWAVQDKLRAKYPGWTGTAGDLSRGPATVQELIRASEDPALANTDAGKGLRLYLEARDEAIADAQAMGVKDFKTAKRAAPLRQWLDEVAEWVLDQHPGFIDMWDRVLSREIEEAA